MIRIVETASGAIVSTVFTLDMARGIVEIAPDETEIHPADLLAAVKAEATVRVLAEADRYGARLTAGYPMSEQASWTAKADEARAIAAGATPSSDLHPVIMAEAMFTGRSPAEIATAIVAKAALFARAAGAISGIRQAALARIDEAVDETGIAEALAWAKATAEAAFAGLGS